MAYNHGVSVIERPTALTPPASTGSVPVVIGTAPVNLSQRATAPVNEPVLCFSYDEAVAAFGYSNDWRFTLSEVIYSHFALFAMSPIVLINVLDPATDKTALTGESVSMVNNLAVVAAQGILGSSVAVKSADGETTYVLGTDYDLDYDGDGQLVIQRITGGAITGSSATLTVDYEELDPDAVTSADIIGGIDGSGQPTGLELVNQVFPRFRLLPGMVLAPGYSDDPGVAAVMVAKAGNINGLFRATAIVDLAADMNYSDAPAWKADNSYSSPAQIAAYPMVKLGDWTFHLSTQVAGVLAATDAANGDIPYVSPSNQSLRADAAVLADGTPMFLGPEQAAYLNGEGIVTALNFLGGWKAWGNRTAAYPGTTDPKDAFIPVRRMMDWIRNTLILTYWQRLDAPITPRLIEAITDSVNLWLNGLAAQGAILGGRVEFNLSENPQTDLMDGIIRLHVYVTPPSPARSIEFIVEYDPAYLSALFAG
ncbi:phage tail sheath family protein [Paenibacillus daejeonensis]|uniref:phage tail sheath family protein n=1 Tax=Paenibacillus daejeonensis TaxID=135193 RepID=UPI00037E5424|nr:hypothetical protein [Paenibacillus daejeonensis]